MKVITNWAYEKWTAVLQELAAHKYCIVITREGKQYDEHLFETLFDPKIYFTAYLESITGQNK
jgi:hypothetical protein